jgi:hypothetical protein
MKLSSYFFLSMVAMMIHFMRAYSEHEQFYPTVVYLTTDKISLAVM